MVGINPGRAPHTARPPTPPKESSTKLTNGNDPGLPSFLTNRPLLDTPDESPSSSAEYFKISSGKNKRVGFSPWTEFHKAPIHGSKNSHSEGSIRRLPASKECKSLKSILKACPDYRISHSENERLAVEPTSFAAMLCSTIQHLKSNSRTSRLDAYSTLLASLSAYDDVPDMTDLSEKVAEITDCIRRDVSEKAGESNASLDVQLVTQALKVLTAFLCTPAIATLLPEDFCSFILDRSLSSIEDAASSKILVSHYMHLLEKQRFVAKVMTTDRVNRLLTTLNVITTRVKGNRTVCHRLMIYRRLLIQAKSVMAARVGSWIDHLISAMLSSIKDVRVRAIGFGVEAGLQLGNISSVSQSCVEVLNRTSPEGKKVVDFLSSRLVEMVSSQEEGVHVPQIWSVIILFFRSRRRQLECWQHVKAWLVVIQRCLNSSDPQVKFQANIAWCRLIFVINLDTSTSNSMAKMLRQPMMSQLERKASDKPSKQAKQVARSTYCTLLYYAFRPEATHAQLDQYWDLYVAEILPISFATGKSDVKHACDIFAALLSANGKPKVWDENRANINGPAKPDELPCLDPKWLRSRAAKVIQLYEKLLELADWQTRIDPEAPIRLAWRNFMTALSAASSKEVKVSIDTMKAVSHITNLQKRLLEKSRQPLRDCNGGQREEDGGKPNNTFGELEYLIQEAVAKIGSIPFLERRLILTSHDSFEAAETPSSRSIRDSGSVNSPAVHLLNLLLTHAPREQYVASYVRAIRAVMEITLQSVNSRRTRLSVLHNLARLLSEDNIFDRQANLVFWQLLAEATSSSLRISTQNDPRNISLQFLGHEYKEAVKILELGIHQRSEKTISAWTELYISIATSLRQDIGDDGVTLLVTEPLADVITSYSNTCDDTFLDFAATLLHDAHWPQSRPNMERAQKLVWGNHHAPHYLNFDYPFDRLFNMIDVLLGKAYRCLATLPVKSLLSFISSVIAVIRSCPRKFQESMLRRLQQGLAAWIEDTDGKIISTRSPILVDIALKVDSLWAEMVNAIESCPDHNTQLLLNLQHVLLPGFRSRHMSILNRCVVLWNRTFGNAEALEYPENLRNAFLRLRSITDLHLPAFPEVEVDQVAYSPTHFVDVQDVSEEVRDLPLAQIPTRTAREAFTRSGTKALGACQHSPSSSPTRRSLRQESKTTPKARLRHDDSQIHFAAVESSPLNAEPAESQHLTDRQKEVKERQGLEAAMFPEIRSSPNNVPKQAEPRLPKLLFRPDQVQVSRTVADEQISPVYPPDALMNDFLGSSPTPASSKKGTNSTQIDVIPPSSPLLLRSPSKTNREVANVQVAHEQVPLLVASEAPEPTVENDALEVTTSMNASERYSAVDASANEPGGRDQDQILESNAPAHKADDRIFSDSDVFVDAPSEPIEKSLGYVQAEKTTTAPEPLHEDDPFQFRSEDDQITAQLINEIERASSQQSNKQSQTTKLATKASRKRKGTFDQADVASKKVKNSADQQHISQTPQGREFAECVLINVRPVESDTAACRAQIKRERSQSPSFIADTPREKEVSASKQKSRPGVDTPRARQSGQTVSSVPSSLRQKRRKVGSNVKDRVMTPPSARKSARLRGTSTSGPRHLTRSPSMNVAAEPGSLTKTGKRRASKRWFWGTEDSVEEDNQTDADTNVTSADMDGNVEMTGGQDQVWEPQLSEHTQQLPREVELENQEREDQYNRASTNMQGSDVRQSEVSVVDEWEEAASPQGILRGFRQLLGKIKRVALRQEEEREMIGVLFEGVKEVHEAGRRQSAL